MTAPYRLYGGGVSRSLAVQMLLEEAGLSYELIYIDAPAGGHRTPEYLALNPAGYTPALVTPEGEAMHEAPAMLLYIAERHGLTDMAPAPADPDRARFLSKLFYLVNEIQPAMKQMFYPHRYTKGGDIAAARDAGRAIACDRWSVLERYLAEHGPLHLGDRFSLLDLNMSVWASYGFEDTTDIVDAFPSVRRVVERVLERPRSGELLRKMTAELDSYRTTRRMRETASG